MPPEAKKRASARDRQGGEYDPPILAEPAGGRIPKWDDPDENEPEIDFDDQDDEPVSRARDGRELHRYWTAGPGLAKWNTSPRPWTALYRRLRKYMPAGKAKRTAAQWFYDVRGYWPGHQAGTNKTGPG